MKRHFIPDENSFVDRYTSKRMELAEFSEDIKIIVKLTSVLKEHTFRQPITWTIVNKGFFEQNLKDLRETGCVIMNFEQQMYFEEIAARKIQKLIKSAKILL
jgi:hypothetical protein